jgi:hypothetical protein
VWLAQTPHQLFLLPVLGGMQTFFLLIIIIIIIIGANCTK